LGVIKKSSVKPKTEIKMKQIIHSSIFLLAILIASVGLITTINEYPDFAYVIAFILLVVLGGLGVKKFLDDRRIK
jgi:Ca2+/Na+ antiporter